MLAFNSIQERRCGETRTADHAEADPIIMPTETVERRSTIATARNAGIPRLLARVQSEYQEMPGLTLTEAQAQRLWDLDRTTCGIVLSTLTTRGFLRRTQAGRYVRASV